MNGLLENILAVIIQRKRKHNQNSMKKNIILNNEYEKYKRNGKNQILGNKNL